MNRLSRIFRGGAKNEAVESYAMTHMLNHVSTQVHSAKGIMEFAEQSNKYHFPPGVGQPVRPSHRTATEHLDYFYLAHPSLHRTP